MIIEIEPQPQLLPKNVFKGQELGGLPLSDKLKFAGQISAELKKHPGTMLQYNPQEIVGFMDSGLSAIALNPQNQHELGAYGRLHPWERTNTNAQLVFEFRTWISAVKGNGINVLKAALELGKEIDPHSQLIAIVEANNSRANMLFQKFGGLLVPRPSNVPVVLREGQAQVNCYDLTHI